MLVEEVSSALVREYLTRKGFKNTLEVFDDEVPRTKNSINNRVKLAKEIGIEKLLQRNKKQERPYVAMVEVIVEFFQQRNNLRDDIANVTARNRSSVESSDTYSSSRSSEPIGYNEGPRGSPRNRGYSDPTHHRQVSPTFSVGSHQMVIPFSTNHNSLERQKKHSSMQRGSSSTLPSKSSRFLSKFGKLKMKQDHNDNYAVAAASPTQSANGYNSGYNSLELNRRNPKSPSVQSPTTLEPVFNSRPHSRSPSKMNGDAIIITNIDEDFDDRMSMSSVKSPGHSHQQILHTRQYDCFPITLEIAMELKSLIFGNPNGSFKHEWLMQSFTYSNVPSLSYGLVQYKGGPCGVLAAVQAYILRHLLFSKDNRKKWGGMPHVSPVERTVALASSLSEIIWQAGDCKLGFVVMPTGNPQFQCTAKFRPDRLTETLSIYRFKSHGNLMGFIAQNISHFQNEKGRGCVLFLYSVILSRGIETIRSDMDEPDGTLMGSHYFCTQEVVNLLLTGHAVSNAFDGTIALDSGGPTKSILKGIDRQSLIGFLSLFEHYDSYKVGDNYKTPKHPIWIVCSESHFSVLVSYNSDLLTDRRVEEKFDLFYYDGLGRQDEEIRLSVDTKAKMRRRMSNDLIPPLEHCIRTRWKDATISWNSTEPLL